MAQIATFGAGCFWGVEALFAKQTGVTNTSVGYMGGTLENPTYRDVCSGQTEHVEVVHIEFDEHLIDYTALLTLFWQNHDPTTLNRQGPDIGTQYRSVVFYHSAEQQADAESMLTQLQQSGEFGAPIVTAIESAQEYYLAEEYHQKYLDKRKQNLNW